VGTVSRHGKAAEIIHNDLGRTKHLVPAAIAALGNLQDDMIRLGRVMAHDNGLLPVRIEGLPNVLCRLDAWPFSNRRS